jgi:hypothetical protein
MTDDKGLDPRWEDLPHDVRAELEGMGITEALFEGRVDDPSFEAAIQHLEARNQAEEAAMPPKIRQAYRKAVMMEIGRDIENDAFLKDLEHNLNQEDGDR